MTMNLEKIVEAVENEDLEYINSFIDAYDKRNSKTDTKSKKGN